MKLIVFIIFIFVLEQAVDCRKKFRHARRHHHRTQQPNSDDTSYNHMSKHIRHHQREMNKHKRFMIADLRGKGGDGSGRVFVKDDERPCQDPDNEIFGCGKGYFEHEKRPCRTKEDEKFGCGKGYFDHHNSHQENEPKTRIPTDTDGLRVRMRPCRNKEDDKFGCGKGYFAHQKG